MRNWRKAFLYLVILIVILLIVALFFSKVGYSVEEVTGQDDLFIEPLEPSVPLSLIPKLIPKPTETPELLEGKELYIFYIGDIANQYYPNVDPYIVQAVMELESNYRPDVGSNAGAVGLMQVMPKYHLYRIEKYGLTDIWDPYANILCGIDLLNELYQKYGDWSTALLGYNRSTKYVNAVLAKADILRKDGYFG